MVNITTEPINNTHGVDCNLLPIPKGADFCSINQRLTFEPGNTKLTVSVPIINNLVPEGREEFRVKLEEPSGCLIPKWPERLIYITDYEDCKSYCMCACMFVKLCMYVCLYAYVYVCM